MLYRIFQSPVGHKTHTGSKFEESHVYGDGRLLEIFKGARAKIEAREFVLHHHFENKTKEIVDETIDIAA